MIKTIDGAAFSRMMLSAAAEIDLNKQKVNELNSQAIDVVWNGMTLTDGVTSAMACTNAYCKNAQVVVVRGQ